jgi:hypothetical protein
MPMAESAAPRPTVHVDAGAEGRIMVADSLSFYEHEPWINDVAVGASFAVAPTAAMAMRQGVKAWIAHEAGPGKDEAGVSGLPFADRYGTPAAAIATMEARLDVPFPFILGDHGVSVRRSMPELQRSLSRCFACSDG